MKEETIEIDSFGSSGQYVEKIVVPSKASSIGSLREKVIDFIDALPFSETERMDIITAVGEACTNAFRHGSPKGEWTSVENMGTPSIIEKRGMFKWRHIILKSSGKRQ